ncbi:hypothetical protein ACOMHN_044806 [Nucella lapillus]
MIYGVYTQYKTFLAKDKMILKRLMKGTQSKRPVEAQNAILRRHFLEMTQSFMIPLERYMASLMPLQRNISPHKGPPRLRPFDTEEFLHTVEHSGPQLTSGIKGDWEGLYRRYFKSPNFEGWYYQRQREVNQKLQVLHMDALCDCNLEEWIQDKEEVEIVDLILMYVLLLTCDMCCYVTQNLEEWIQDKEEVEIVDLILRIKEKLKFASNNHMVVQRESITKLQKHLETVVSTLPDDLQTVIKT